MHFVLLQFIPISVDLVHFVLLQFIPISVVLVHFVLFQFIPISVVLVHFVLLQFIPISVVLVHFVLFQFIPIDSFGGQSSAGQMVVVVAGGKNIPLHFHNRLHYVDTVLQYRLHEWDKQVRP